MKKTNRSFKLVDCDPAQCGRCWACKRSNCYECDKSFCDNFKSVRPCKILPRDEWATGELKERKEWPKEVMV